MNLLWKMEGLKIQTADECLVYWDQHINGKEDHLRVGKNKRLKLEDDVNIPK